MKISIIGYGIVGHHVEELIKNHYEYCIYDPNYEIPIPKESTSSTLKDAQILVEGQPPLATQEYINKNCGLSVICVPTPMAEDGSCDTSIVEESVEWLKTPLILVKSTVEPGTVDRLNKQYRKFNTGDRLKHIIFSPEYISESTYYNPIIKTMKDSPFIIFGGDPIDTQAMVDIFKPILGPLVKYVQCSAIEAEMAKYLENVFFAVKVSFFNEFYSACEAFDVSYDKVREIFLNDPRINPFHSAVFADNRGWAGKCFPKDINAFVKACEKKGFEPKIIKQVIESNKELRQKYNN